jgi:hypothetical protein
MKIIYKLLNLHYYCELLILICSSSCSSSKLIYSYLILFSFVKSLMSVSYFYRSWWEENNGSDYNEVDIYLSLILLFSSIIIWKKIYLKKQKFYKLILILIFIIYLYILSNFYFLFLQYF